MNLRPIPGFAGYFASDDGRVLSMKSGTLRELRYVTERSGYRRVYPCRNGRNVTRRVHVLVAAAWIGPRPPGLDVCHNDGDATNNHRSNLRYGTRRSNIGDAVRHGTFAVGEQHGNAVLTDAAVRQMRALRRAGLSLAEIGRRFGGLDSGHVSQVTTGRIWRHVKEET